MKSEHIEQREFVSWFRKNHKEVKIFAIPNGGLRDKITASKLKLEGVLPGVPDLFVPEWNLWIEMKREKESYLSDNQKKMIKYLEGAGYHAIVGYGCNNAIAELEDFLEDK